MTSLSHDQRRHLPVWLLLAIVAGCSRPAAPSSEPSSDRAFPDGLSADDILQNMAEAYRAADSYVDNAQYHERYVRRDVGTEHDVPPHILSVLCKRPGHVRITRQVPATDGPGLDVAVISDGRRMRAFVSDYMRQVLEKPAPAKVTSQSLLADERLREALLPVPLENLFPQFDLLTADESALAALLSLGPARRLASRKLVDKPCYRIQIDQSGEGSRVLWIDQESWLLRRMEMPTGRVRAELDRETRLADLALWIDFHDAEFGLTIDDEAFQMEVPDGAVRVREFIQPPQPPPPELGQRIDRFELADLDGEIVDAQELADKVLVLDFWHTGCDPCSESVPALEKLRKHFGEEQRVAVYAVSVDPPQVANATIEKALRTWGGEMPILRDANNTAQESFAVRGWPTTLLLGPDRKVHRFVTGAQDDYSGWIADIDALLAGEDVAEAAIQSHQQAVRQFEAALADAQITDQSSTGE